MGVASRADHCGRSSYLLVLSLGQSTRRGALPTRGYMALRSVQAMNGRANDHIDARFFAPPAVNRYAVRCSAVLPLTRGVLLDRPPAPVKALYGRGFECLHDSPNSFLSPRRPGNFQPFSDPCCPRICHMDQDSGGTLVQVVSAWK